MKTRKGGEQELTEASGMNAKGENHEAYRGTEPRGLK